MKVYAFFFIFLVGEDRDNSKKIIIFTLHE